MTSSLNLRTLASGVEAISAVLGPPRVSQANKADQTLDEWKDKLVKLGAEYGQELTAKMKVAVLSGMMPKDLQDNVLDECAVNWDETTESEAGRLYTKIKATLRNIAKARREMAGPKPMEVDRVADWRESGPTIGTVSIATRVRLRRSNVMRRAATRRTHSTSERAVARWAERVSKDNATSVVGSGTRSGIATRARVKGKVSARTVGMAKVMARKIRRQGVRQRKGRRWQGRHAEGLFWVWVYGACHQGLPEEHERPASGGGRPRDCLHRQRSDQRSRDGRRCP